MNEKLNDFINTCIEADEKAYKETANFMISRMYSGHMYYNSPYETSDSCGNCDGAMCDWCKPKFRISEWDDLNILGRDTIYFDDYQAARDMLRCLETKAENLGYNVTRTSESYLEAYVKPKEK